MQGMDLERNQQQPPAGRCRRRRGGMQRAHSAIREHSDHLITFQSGLPHAAHQPLQDKTPPGEPDVRGGSRAPVCPSSHSLACSLQDPQLSASTQGSEFLAVKWDKDCHRSE